MGLTFKTMTFDEFSTEVKEHKGTYLLKSKDGDIVLGQPRKPWGGSRNARRWFIETHCGCTSATSPVFFDEATEIVKVVG